MSLLPASDGYRFILGPLLALCEHLGQADESVSVFFSVK